MPNLSNVANEPVFSANDLVVAANGPVFGANEAVFTTSHIAYASPEAPASAPAPERVASRRPHAGKGRHALEGFRDAARAEAKVPFLTEGEETGVAELDDLLTRLHGDAPPPGNGTYRP